MTHRIALFLDLDNAVLAAEELGRKHRCRRRPAIGGLVDEVERVVGGRVEHRVAYGNVMLRASGVFAERTPDAERIRAMIAEDSEVQAQLAHNGFRVLHTPTRGGAGKNAADIALCLDAVTLAERCPHVDVIAILSHDSDFSALAHRLRELGRRVALVTVGRPRFRGMAALRAATDWHVVCDPAPVEGVGHDAAAPSAEQPALPVREAAMAAPTGAVAPGAVPLHAESPAAVGCTGRADAWHATLRDVHLHPHPEVRAHVEFAARRAHTHLDAARGVVTYRALSERVSAALAGVKVSAGAVRNCLNLLRGAGVLRVAASEGSCHDRQVTGFAAPAAVPELLIRQVCRELADAGHALDEADADQLATFIFGSEHTAPYIRSVLSEAAAAK